MRVANLDFRDPLIISSGILPDIPELMERICKEYEPSAITTKTLTFTPLEPHKPPTVIEFHNGCYMNAIGLGNPGVGIIEKIKLEKCKLFVSIGGNNIEDIIKSAEIVESKAEIIEINASSPNRKGYGESISSIIHEIVKEVKSHVRKPVFVKIGPWDNALDIVGKALDAGADGITAINTLKGLMIDTEEFKPVLSYGTGGISGRCIYPLALRTIKDIYEEYETDIIGMGGIFSFREVLGMLSVGAKLTGLGSVILDSGYEVISEIRRNLINYLNEKGLKLEDIFAIAVKK
ncbi:dihydroorotate dehydrogenase PyrD [Acidianus sp. HS-5]|uniref:dihydroorotate dehydrogenase PyrD n=1 Tax=Acidianus sp. HS-5 TaxID=2886040 RepID=UPI001F2BFA19|nr:dihydroorotate dehydrogenase PyrD [Acidianus sp. HS-5]BDC19639.1 dihydroorotate dehydrogenase [Acidianus sp. HS-5]